MLTFSKNIKVDQHNNSLQIYKKKPRDFIFLQGKIIILFPGYFVLEKRQ